MTGRSHQFQDSNEVLNTVLSGLTLPLATVADLLKTQVIVSLIDWLVIPLKKGTSTLFQYASQCPGLDP